MAKKKKKEEPQAQSEQEQLEQLEQQQLSKKQKQGRGPLLTILTVLLILVGLGEAGLWGYFGFSSFQANRALRRYEAERAAAAENRPRATASAYGPRMRIENGQIVWQLDEDEDIDPTAGGTISPARNDGGQTTPSAGTIGFPRIPYVLAEQETESPSQETDPAGNGSATLT